MTKALAPVRAAATDAIAALRGMSAIGAGAFPAVGYAVLAQGYLNRLGADPYRPDPPSPLIARQLRLSWASLTGRL